MKNLLLVFMVIFGLAGIVHFAAAATTAEPSVGWFYKKPVPTIVGDSLTCTASEAGNSKTGQLEVVEIFSRCSNWCRGKVIANFGFNDKTSFTKIKGAYVCEPPASPGNKVEYDGVLEDTDKSCKKMHCPEYCCKRSKDGLTCLQRCHRPCGTGTIEIKKSKIEFTLLKLGFRNEEGVAEYTDKCELSVGDVVDNKKITKNTKIRCQCIQSLNAQPAPVCFDFGPGPAFTVTSYLGADVKGCLDPNYAAPASVSTPATTGKIKVVAKKVVDITKDCRKQCILIDAPDPDTDGDGDITTNPPDPLKIDSPSPCHHYDTNGSWSYVAVAADDSTDNSSCAGPAVEGAPPQEPVTDDPWDEYEVGCNDGGICSLGDDDDDDDDGF